MILSTLAIAMGIVLLVPVRMSETPQALGLVVVVATVIIAAGCALHLSSIVDSLPSLAAPWRAALVLVAWLATFGGAAWAISRAPGDELLYALLAAPTSVGVAGVVWAPAGRRWHAIPFLGLALCLALLLVPAWLARQGTG